MKVKDLKELLKGVDEDLDVMVSTDDQHLHCAETELSGYAEFGEPCNDDGTPIEGTQGGMKVFMIVAKTVMVEEYEGT